jgi:hypothetical protein
MLQEVVVEIEMEATVLQEAKAQTLVMEELVEAAKPVAVALLVVTVVQVLLFFVGLHLQINQLQLVQD